MVYALLAESTTGRLVKAWGQIGVTTNAGSSWPNMGPPADKLCAVEPTGVLTMRPSPENPDTISPDKPFGHALIMMYDHGYRHMPVIEEGKAVGIVSMRDAAPPELHELEVDIQQREHISEILG